MTRDPSKDDKKCGGPGSADRIFHFEKSNAQKTNCLNKCEEDQNCVAMSGVWGEWCIGCKVQLASGHSNAEAFKKDK